MMALCELFCGTWGKGHQGKACGSYSFNYLYNYVKIENEHLGKKLLQINNNFKTTENYQELIAKPKFTSVELVVTNIYIK